MDEQGAHGFVLCGFCGFIVHCRITVAVVMWLQTRNWFISCPTDPLKCSETTWHCCLPPSLAPVTTKLQGKAGDVVTKVAALTMDAIDGPIAAAGR